MRIFGSRCSVGVRAAVAVTIAVLGACVNGGNDSAKAGALKNVASAPSGVLPSLSVGIQVSPAMTLVMVANDAGLFRQEGVAVEIKQFTAGKFALQAFLGGSLDLAVSGEVPVTLATLQGNDLRVIAQVVERTTNEVRVVVRKDKAGDTPKAYFHRQRRKLATSFGGGPEFFTYNFLKRHGIKRQEVELLSQRPEDMPSALAAGAVDAVSIFDPFARIAERQLGTSGQTFADPDIYSELYVVDASPRAVREKPAVLRSFLRGLKRAEGYVHDHPDKAKQILVKYTKLDAALVDDIWPAFTFRTVLNHRLIDYMTAEAHWAIEKKDFPASTVVPDFRKILAPELLADVDPTAVQVK
jgi:NitT/TauT family transport system substrate-binding protein